MLGVHPSLLPRYRGASPLAWTILNADETTGATVFRLNERLDAGDTLLQRVVPTNPQDTAEGLSERLAQLGAALLLEALERLETNQASFTPQDEAGATYAPKLTKAQGRIDWRAPAAAIDRVVRATIPWPGASTDWHGQSLKLWATSFDSHNHGKPGEPGTVLSATAEGIVVATGEGKLRIRELQLAGRRRMGVGEFLSGHPLHVGDILGSGQ
jgi:methionyl-tRNA formyltransferase